MHISSLLLRAVFTFIVLSFLPLASAEIIHLNDGSTVEGKIIKKTTQSVTVNVKGIEMIYYADEIWDIDGVSFVSKKENNPTKVSVASGDLFHLSIDQFNQGKYEEATANYYKAVALGFKPDPVIEKVMRPYKYREFSVKSPYGPQILFKGKTNCSDPLIHNLLRSILSKIDDPKDVVLIKPEFTQFSKNGKDFKEQWVVQTKNTTKTFFIFLFPTADDNADYNIKEKINDADFSQFGDLSVNPGSAVKTAADDQHAFLGSIFIDGRQWDSNEYHKDDNITDIIFYPKEGGSEQLIYGAQKFTAEQLMYEKGLIRLWSNAVWQSFSSQCSNPSAAVIKDAAPYIIGDLQCPDSMDQYQITRFETDQDAGAMVMLMYRVHTPPPLEIKNKWIQNLDSYVLRENQDIKLILQKIDDLELSQSAGSNEQHPQDETIKGNFWDKFKMMILIIVLGSLLFVVLTVVFNARS